MNKYSFFHFVSTAPDDPILSLPFLFAIDPRKEKVNLSIGSYRTEDGKPYVLEAVKSAEKKILDAHLDKEYLPMQGDSAYLKAVLPLIFGSTDSLERIFVAQAVGGTGALKLAGAFLAQETSRELFFSEQTWPNHGPIFTNANLKVGFYPYYDESKHALDFPAMCQSILAMPPGSAVLLQPCCHNPTGANLTIEQWQELSALILKNRLLPFFDLAYQGFGESVEADVYPIRYFYSQGHEMAVTVSFSKTFGLYGERVGLFALVASDSLQAKTCGTQIKQIIRTIYSSPPLHGGRIISAILSDPILKKEWMDELKNMRGRIEAMRETLAAGLEAKMGNDFYAYIKTQVGFFSLLGITEGEAARLQKEKGVYLPFNGRINIAGLNAENMDYVIDSLVSLINERKK